MKFHPNGKELILACLNKIYLVSYDSNRGVTKKEGIWKQNTSPVSLLSIAFIESKVATGTYLGDVLLWDKDICTSSKHIFKDSPVLGITKLIKFIYIRKKYFF